MHITQGAAHALRKLPGVLNRRGVLKPRVIVQYIVQAHRCGADVEVVARVAATADIGVGEQAEARKGRLARAREGQRYLQ